MNDDPVHEPPYRVYRSTRGRAGGTPRLCPSERIALHAHPDHVVYVFDDGKLKLSSPDGKSVEVVLKAGQTLWIPAETHAAENVGSTDAHSLVVELKESSSKR